MSETTEARHNIEASGTSEDPHGSTPRHRLNHRPSHTTKPRKGHIHIRILESIISGFPRVLGLRTRPCGNPYVCVVFGALKTH